MSQHRDRFSRSRLLVAGAITALFVLAASCSGSDGRAAGPTTSTSSSAATSDSSASGSSTPTTGSDRPGDAPSGDAVTLDCADQIDTEGPPGGYADVLGVVALPTKGARPEPLTVTAAEGVDGARFYAEDGLFVRGGQSAELILGADTPDGARIGWGSPATPTRRFVIPACPGRGWWVFPGGYWVRDATCLPVTVRTAVRETTVEIQVAAPCPQ